MKRSLESEQTGEPPQPLIDALDALINPVQCVVEYDVALIQELQVLKDQTLAADTELMRFYEKIQSRRRDAIVELDEPVSVVAPAVRRSSTDKHYLMSLLCINMGRLEELKPMGMERSVCMYSEALAWHPVSVEAGLCLGVVLRHQVTSQTQLDRVEGIWRNSFNAARAYSFLSRSKPAVSINNPSVPFSSYNRMIQNREKKITKELADVLILHFCQQDKLSLAMPIMNAYRYRYKLSQEVLCYPISTGTSAFDSSTAKEACNYAIGVDAVVPPSLLAKLQYVFRPDAPFWKEHNYDFFSNASRSVGYFSYLFPYRELRPANVVEQAICMIYDIVSEKFPDISKKSTMAEWWVHSRPHSCGHQFHFDSDETRIYAGKNAQHPIISCVLYLTPDGGRVESIGGPTVITNQTLQSEGLATEGFMFLPKENRMVAFDSKYLHGVVPGRGICPGPDNSRRLTFMVGFWEKIQSETRGVDCPGPGQPYPGRHATALTPSDGSIEYQSKYTWPAEMESSVCDSHDTGDRKEVVGGGGDDGGDIVRDWLEPIAIPTVWEPVNEAPEGLINTPGKYINAHYDQCFQGF